MTEEAFVDKEKNPDSIPNQHKAGTADQARKDADALDKAYGEGVTDIKNQHKSGDPVDARRGLHNKSIDEVAQATKLKMQMKQTKLTVTVSQRSKMPTLLVKVSKLVKTLLRKTLLKLLLRQKLSLLKTKRLLMINVKNSY